MILGIRKGVIKMKVFRFICIMLLLALTLIAAYYAWVYKASLSTGVFFQCASMLLFVASDDSMDKKKIQKNK